MICVCKTINFGRIIVVIEGGKNGRGIRLSQYDPDDPMSPSGGTVPQTYNSLDNPSRPPISVAPKLSTVPQNYTEKTMLLSSDEEN